MRFIGYLQVGMNTCLRVDCPGIVSFIITQNFDASDMAKIKSVAAQETAPILKSYTISVGLSEATKAYVVVVNDISPVVCVVGFTRSRMAEVHEKATCRYVNGCACATLFFLTCTAMRSSSTPVIILNLVL